MPRLLSRFFFGDVVAMREGPRIRADLLALLLITSSLSGPRGADPHGPAAAPGPATRRTCAGARGAGRPRRRDCAPALHLRRGVVWRARSVLPPVAGLCS